MPAQEYRNPLDAGTLSRILLDLALSEHAGIVHVGSIDSMSRYEMARRLAEKIGYPAS
jgi:dTDP-4-dehydrorhamnose reductase